MDQAKPPIPNPRVVVAQFDITLNLTDRRQMRLQGYFYEDDTVKDRHLRLDEAQDILDRQFARSDIFTKEKELESAKLGLEGFLKHLDSLTDAQEKGHKLSAHEKDQLRTHKVNLEREKERIRSLESALVEARKKVALT